MLILKSKYPSIGIVEQEYVCNYAGTEAFGRICSGIGLGNDLFFLDSPRTDGIFQFQAEPCPF